MADLPQEQNHHDLSADDAAFYRLLQEVAQLEAENSYLKTQNQKLQAEFNDVKHSPEN